MAQVGNTTISSIQLPLKQRVAGAYSDDKSTITTPVAAVMLVADALNAEVASKLGLLPSASELSLFRQHVMTTTQAPALLEKIRLIYGDETNFELQYLQPRLTEMKLQSYRSRNRQLHQGAVHRIEASMRDLMTSPAVRFQVVATSYTLSYKEVRLASDTSTQTGQLSGLARDNPVLKVAQSLKPGEIYQNVIESDHDYMLLRLLRREGDDHICEVATAEKMTYEEWLARECETISIVFFDHALFKAIERESPELPWLRRAILR